MRVLSEGRCSKGSLSLVKTDALGEEKLKRDDCYFCISLL